MAQAKIKEEFKSTFIAFNGGGKKLLGERDDIDVLAIMAHESRNPTLLNLFEVLPPLADLKKARLDSELKKSGVVIKPASKKVDTK